MKNSYDTIGNRTRDLPVCSAVPQPTAPPRTPITILYSLKIQLDTITHRNRITSQETESPPHYKICVINDSYSPHQNRQ